MKQTFNKEIPKCFSSRSKVISDGRFEIQEEMKRKKRDTYTGRFKQVTRERNRSKYLGS